MGILSILLSSNLLRIYYAKCQNYTSFGAKMIKIQILFSKSLETRGCLCMHLLVCACIQLISNIEKNI